MKLRFSYFILLALLVSCLLLIACDGGPSESIINTSVAEQDTTPAPVIDTTPADTAAATTPADTTTAPVTTPAATTPAESVPTDTTSPSEAGWSDFH